MVECVCVCNVLVSSLCLCLQCHGLYVCDSMCNLLIAPLSLCLQMRQEVGLELKKYEIDKNMVNFYFDEVCDSSQQ